MQVNGRGRVTSAYIGEVTPPDWLDAVGLLSYLVDTPIGDKTDRQRAALAYAELVNDTTRVAVTPTAARPQRLMSTG
jgi:hypothetical protein